MFIAQTKSKVLLPEKFAGPQSDLRMLTYMSAKGVET